MHITHINNDALQCIFTCNSYGKVINKQNRLLLSLHHFMVFGTVLSTLLHVDSGCCHILSLFSMCLSWKSTMNIFSALFEYRILDRYYCSIFLFFHLLLSKSQPLLWDSGPWGFPLRSLTWLGVWVQVRERELRQGGGTAAALVALPD